jgi:chlorobactene glucosyltransferase
MPVLPALRSLFGPLGIYTLFWLIFSIGVLANAVTNFFFFLKPKAPIVANDELPFISVLVPARNEEQNISACVRSLLNQNYPSFEVIALDDSSEDGTYEQLCYIRDQDHRLRVLVGAQLPTGWCGKPHACWQLAKAATGTYLLFTDADCLLMPDALLFAVGAAHETNSDVISLMPDYLAVTFWEKLVIPLLVAIPIAFLPFFMVRLSRSRTFAAANGAFIFLSRADYFDMGGHQAVRSELAEDIKFSQRVKMCGKSLSYMDGKNVYKVRMYDSFGAIWKGFTRNLLPAFDNIWFCLLAMFVVLNLFVLPPFFAAVGFVLAAPWAAISAATYLTMLSMRCLIALILDRDSILFGVLNPVSWSIAFAIAIGSIIRNNGQGAEWKGRIYKDIKDE